MEEPQGTLQGSLNPLPKDEWSYTKVLLAEYGISEYVLQKTSLHSDLKRFTLTKFKNERDYLSILLSICDKFFYLADSLKICSLVPSVKGNYSWGFSAVYCTRNKVLIKGFSTRVTIPESFEYPEAYFHLDLGVAPVTEFLISRLEEFFSRVVVVKVNGRYQCTCMEHDGKRCNTTIAETGLTKFDAVFKTYKGYIERK